MADDVGFARIEGLDQAKAALRALPDRLRRRALRNALAAGGRVVRDQARRQAPVLAASDPAVIKGLRKPGTVRRALSVRTSKLARRAGNVGVYINVRPAKRGQRGARNPADPFYWRWLEFGTRNMRARPFLQPAAQALGRALDAFRAALGPALAKLNTPRGDA